MADFLPVWNEAEIREFVRHDMETWNAHCDQVQALKKQNADLRALVESALTRLTPEQRALYDEIVAIHDGFGEPVDERISARTEGGVRGDRP